MQLSTFGKHAAAGGQFGCRELCADELVMVGGGEGDGDGGDCSATGDCGADGTDPSDPGVPAACVVAVADCLGMDATAPGASCPGLCAGDSGP